MNCNETRACFRRIAMASLAWKAAWRSKGAWPNVRTARPPNGEGTHCRAHSWQTRSIIAVRRQFAILSRPRFARRFPRRSGNRRRGGLGGGRVGRGLRRPGRDVDAGGREQPRCAVGTTNFVASHVHSLLGELCDRRCLVGSACGQALVCRKARFRPHRARLVGRGIRPSRGPVGVYRRARRGRPGLRGERHIINLFVWHRPSRTGQPIARAPSKAFSWCSGPRTACLTRRFRT